MAEKITLKKIHAMLSYVVEHMATKEDIARLDGKIDTVDMKVDRLQGQVNSIEQQLRHTKVEIRLADLEEKVFGKARA